MTQLDQIDQMNRLLQVRLEEWLQHDKDSQDRRRPVVTITREPGCGAQTIAKRLCSELGLHLYEWELVEQIAKDADVSARLVSALEENPPGDFADFLAERQKQYSLSSKAYVKSLKRVLLAIAVPGNAVIVGRGSNFFLPPDKKIGLCLVAPLPVRIENLMKELGLSEKDARKHILKLEEEHRKLVKKYAQADLRDPTHYHLVINTALVGPETVVQLVKTLLLAAT